MLLDIEIRERLARYLASEISLREFEDWFVPASWNVHLSGNEEAAQLTYDIEAVLLQASTERWPEERVKKKLAPFVEHYAVTLGERFPLTSLASNRTEEYTWPSSVKAEPVRIAPVAVHRISVMAS